MEMLNKQITTVEINIAKQSKMKRKSNEVVWTVDHTLEWMKGRRRKTRLEMDGVVYHELLVVIFVLIYFTHRYVMQ